MVLVGTICPKIPKDEFIASLFYNIKYNIIRYEILIVLIRYGMLIIV